MKILTFAFVCSLSLWANLSYGVDAAPTRWDEARSTERDDLSIPPKLLVKERWSENKVTLNEEAFELSGIKHSKAKKINMVTTTKLYGRVMPNADHYTEIMPRYEGIAFKVLVKLGDAVKKGAVLAIVEANGSLARYQVKASQTGIIVSKDIVAGKFVTNSKPIFTLADLSDVWVDINVTEQNIPKVKKGQKVFLRLWDCDEKVESTITFVSPVVDVKSQTVLARTVVKNSSGKWRPGSFVTANIVTEEGEVAVAVKQSGVQMVSEKDVVFVKRGEAYYAKRVRLGRKGTNGLVEVLSGVKKGDRYVSRNSFILKAELLKELAGHDHAH